MSNRETVKILSAALEESSNGDLILRGKLDSKSLHLLLTDDYQREVLPMNSQASLVDAFKNRGRIPDVTLGMRGGNVTDRDGTYYLQDPTYIIDGLQRISVALHLMRIGHVTDPDLGCKTYFNTDHKVESDLFRILNSRGQKLSPNIQIRNLKATNLAVEMLFNLCYDKGFVLYDRVCWNQRMKRTELLTCTTVMKVNGMLHSTFGPGVSSRWEEATAAMEKTMRNIVGRTTMRDNIKTFFEVVDGAWGIKSVAFKEGAPYLRSNFLLSLAQLFAHHKTFWDENRHLSVTTDLRAKLRIFPVNDPQVQSLASAGTTARNLLYRLILDHLNSGKRTRRLVAFKNAEPMAIEEGVEEGKEVA
jgi:hypothetical protein